MFSLPTTCYSQRREEEGRERESQKPKGQAMRSLPLGISVSPTNLSSCNLKKHQVPFPTFPFPPPPTVVSRLSKSGICKASQVVELFPAVSPDIDVREARPHDCWEVAETHCSSFFPEYSFPLDFVLRFDRLLAMLAGFAIPSGCKRTCLVAVLGGSVHYIKVGSFGVKFGSNRGYIAGILTIDTVADFLPRKGPLRQRRTGIAYISNVAVRETFRRKGIGKQLVAKAEAQAVSWGCRAIALHCDSSNPGATKLYRSQGFRCVKVPEGANWPQPKTSPDVKFHFMMKLLNSSTTL